MTEQTIHTTVRQNRVATKVENPQTVVETQAVPLTVDGVQADTVTQIIYAGKPGPEGPAGPAGATGPQGPAGTGSGSYVHSQNTASAVWTITHNLGFVPNIRIEDSAGSDVEGDVDVIDTNTLQVTFTAAFGGVAYLS